MRAVAIERGADEPSVIETDRPDPGEGEALVRTLRVGIDGTDHHVIEGDPSRFPAGEDHLVLGHEAVGVVEDPNGTNLAAGTVVAPTVRRRPGETNEYFERGRPDMAPRGMYHERGIRGAHGFMADYFTSPEEFLVEVPDDLADIGFLVEPASITEKALELAYSARSTFEWEPTSGLVLGNGPLGLLTLGMFVHTEPVERAYCLGRRDRPDPTIDVIERLGATYVDSRETSVDDVPEAYEGMDLVYEATGYAKHAFQTIDALAHNGVGAIVGGSGPHEFELDGGSLHGALVGGNRALVGSVNSHVHHFEAGIDALEALPEWLFEELVTAVHDPDDLAAAFDDGEGTIKTAVEFHEA